MKKLTFVICFLLLVPTFVYAFQVDSISFNVNDERIIVSSPKGEILNYKFDDSILSYEYILETPYFWLDGYDGVVEIEKSKGLKSFSKKNLTADAFTEFSLFSRKNNTIGLLIGIAGASGSSGQDIYFINTQTGGFIKIHLMDMQEMTWIMKNGQIVGYKGYVTNVYFGASVTSWGWKARISSVIFFDECGNIAFNKDALKGIYESEYAKINFSNEEKALLQDDIMSDMEHRPLGRKLVDFVYYGFKIGKQKEVFKFLNALNPVYAQEAKLNTAKRIEAPTRPATFQDIEARVDAEYEGLKRAETLGEKDPWIRTRVKGSSAYGELQITKACAQDYLDRGEFDHDKELKEWVKNRYIPYLDSLASKSPKQIKCEIVSEIKWANGKIARCYYSDFSLELRDNKVFLSWDSNIYPFPPNKEEYIGIRKLLKKDLNGDGHEEYIIAVQLKGLKYVYPDGSTSELPECPYGCVVICSPQEEGLKVEFAIIAGESNPDFELVDVDGDGLKDVSASGYSTMGIEHLSIVSWQKSNYKYIWGEDDPGLAAEQRLFLFKGKTPVIKVGRSDVDENGRINRYKLVYKYFVWNGKEFVYSSELSTTPKL